jgi:hypothetical protein
MNARRIAACFGLTSLTAAALAAGAPLRTEALTEALDWAAKDMQIETGACVSLVVLPDPPRRQAKNADGLGQQAETPHVPSGSQPWTAGEAQAALKSFATRKHLELIRSAAPPTSRACRTTVRLNLPSGPIDAFAVRILALARHASARERTYTFRFVSGKLQLVSKSDEMIIVS